MAKFDISKVLVNFDCVITNEEIRKSFLTHLDMERNKENFEFYLDVLDMKNSNLDKTQLKKKITDIFDLYISKESKFEINLSNKEYTKIANKIKEEDFSTNIYDTTMTIVKNEIQIDAFPRFIRTPECVKLVEKYQKDETVVTSYIKKNFLYTNKDFEIHLVTEKDIGLMKALLGDSFDFKHIINNPKNKYNMYLSMDCQSFMPKFDFVKSAGVIKSTYIVPFSLEKTLYYYYDILKNQPLIVAQEDLGFLNHDDMKTFYEKIPENLKINKNEKLTFRTNSTNKFFLKISKLIPLIKSIISLSMDYNESKDEVFVVTKMVTDESQIKDFLKTKKEKVVFLDGKESTQKVKGTIAISCNFYKKIDENKTSVANIILMAGLGSKLLNPIFFKLITKSLAKNHLKIIQDMNKFNFKDDLNFSKFDEYDKKNIFFTQIKDLMINERKTKLLKSFEIDDKNLFSTNDESFMKESGINEESFMMENKEKNKIEIKESKIDEKENNENIIENIEKINEKENIEIINNKEEIKDTNNESIN
jgi:hypothetical protein